MFVVGPDLDWVQFHFTFFFFFFFWWKSIFPLSWPFTSHTSIYCG